MSQYGFYLDLNACIGCGTCVVVCKDKNSLPDGVALRRVHTLEGGAYPQPFAYHISMACNHCESPACFAACAQGAIEKDPDTGAVVVDKESCVGCGACAQACPYQAPVVNLDVAPTAFKCDMCSDRLVEGGQPECVKSCRTRALKLMSVDEIKGSYGSVVRTLPCLPDESETSPALYLDPTSEAVTEPVEEIRL